MTSQLFLNAPGNLFLLSISLPTRFCVGCCVALRVDKLHVHFGAGRLGFGLVLPALESSSSPYVIMNRPSKVWQPVVEREKESQQHVGVKVRAPEDTKSWLSPFLSFKK